MNSQDFHVSPLFAVPGGQPCECFQGASLPGSSWLGSDNRTAGQETEAGGETRALTPTTPSPPTLSFADSCSPPPVTEPPLGEASHTDLIPCPSPSGPRALTGSHGCSPLGAPPSCFLYPPTSETVFSMSPCQVTDGETSLMLSLIMSLTIIASHIFRRVMLSTGAIKQTDLSGGQP